MAWILHFVQNDTFETAPKRGGLLLEQLTHIKRDKTIHNTPAHTGRADEYSSNTRNFNFDIILYISNLDCLQNVICKK